MGVVIINGYSGSGKDTFVELCKKVYPNTENYHTSDSAKEALEVVGWDGERTPEARKLLSELVAFSHKNGLIEEEIQELIDDSEKDVVIFVHCREYENIVRLRQRFNAITLFIQRDSAVTYDNPSDTNVGEHGEIYDYTVYNNGTLTALSYNAQAFMFVATGGYKNDSNV